MAYKTPGVYVQEISLFPPSVAEVETAIPAFIGYTERATGLSGNTLRDVPTKIKSLLEFEAYFGKDPAIKNVTVLLDANNNFLKASFTNNYYLYDSLRLFFDNGGGNCYVVSVGSYADAITDTRLIAGINTLKKYDEPTLLLFPDAAGLGADGLGNVQKAALSQCAKLGDRFSILDVRNTDSNGVSFRNKIGINDLKYGAVYSPWLKVNYNKIISYENVKNGITKGAIPVSLKSLTTDKGIQDLIDSLENAIADGSTIAGKITTLLSGAASISAKYETLLVAYKGTKSLGDLQNIFEFLYKLAELVESLLDAATGIKVVAFKGNIQSAIAGALKNVFSELISNEKELKGAINAYTEQWKIDPDPIASQWGGIFADATSPAASTTVIPAAGTDDQKTDALLPNLHKNFTIVNETIKSFIAAATQYGSTFEKNLYDSYPVYQNLIKGINDTATILPPSGAIAGIYALVDNQRGVWKCPANVSLAGVIEPVYNFDETETDDLNIDANAGKSINAIRAFSGKGTLVWGARTLAGNDNEWRYVSVRRFFNMVEESIKKSSYWAVFESNDGNTWVKVRGSIENYLTQKWREGALAGATPKESFYVKCALGTTMTSQDILEGRMNVEIGMAVVRPAEFIILKFSHKLQTS